MSTDRGSDKVIIALLREAQFQLMLLNREQPSANFRRAQTPSQTSRIPFPNWSKITMRSYEFPGTGLFRPPVA